MSALTVNLPDNLHEKAREVAASKNLSMDALVTIALTQSLSRLVATFGGAGCPRDRKRHHRISGAGSKIGPAPMGSVAGRLSTETVRLGA